MKVANNYGGILAGLCTVLVAGLFSLLTALITTRRQLAGQMAISQTPVTVQAAIGQATVKAAEVTTGETREERIDKKAELLMGMWQQEIARLEKRIATLEAENSAQAARIDQLDTQNIRMRRALEQHGIPVPK